ncbi:hypothetical protein [Deinococcus sonorensis]|uniref:Uncharacterized protein n=2 Tax=Deinococcus sonorensis TaxID=309891 RepID=A0AAU7UBG5_9DEIO
MDAHDQANLEQIRVLQEGLAHLQHPHPDGEPAPDNDGLAPVTDAAEIEEQNPAMGTMQNRLVAGY